MDYGSGLVSLKPIFHRNSDLHSQSEELAHTALRNGTGKQFLMANHFHGRSSTCHSSNTAQHTFMNFYVIEKSSSKAYQADWYLLNNISKQDSFEVMPESNCNISSVLSFLIKTTWHTICVKEEWTPQWQLKSGYVPHRTNNLTLSASLLLPRNLS